MIFDIGRELLAVKARVGHGHFLAWVASEFPFSGRSARNYMKAAGSFGSKSATVADLPARDIYTLAGASPQVRNEVVRRAEAGEPVKEVLKAVRKLKPPKPVEAVALKSATVADLDPMNEAPVGPVIEAV